MELMEFLAAKMPDASRTKLKALLSKRVVYVDSVITTQYNFPLKPGMKVQISREKGRKEFNNKLLKIVYEDAYLIVVEKMQGLLSVNTERQKERTAYTILNEYVQRSGRQHRVYIVHRLDRDTSGLLMFAKDEKTQNMTKMLISAIFHDQKLVWPCSTLLRGEYGQHDVAAGVPCVIGKNGLEEILEVELTDEEQAKFAASCDILRGFLDRAASLKF